VKRLIVVGVLLVGLACLVYARPGPDSNYNLSIGQSFTNWNPSDKGSGVTLSGSNLVATFGEAFGTHEAVRSVASHSSGKFYAEFTATTVVGDSQIGVGDSGFDVTGSPGYLGGSANSLGYSSSGAVFQNNGSTVATYSTYTSGDVIGMAVDFGGQLIWWRVNAGNWNNNAMADPATGANGLSTASIGSGPFFAGTSGNGGSGVTTANFGASAYAHTPPSGYGNW
jgi:hypothetical protein